MHYLFHLGHQPHISTAELTAVFSVLGIDYAVEKETAAHLLIETPAPLDAQRLMTRLGGTIAILERIPQRAGDELTDFLAGYIDAVCPEGKIRFSLHGNSAKKRALEVKKTLKAEGRSVRYIEPKNSATILHNGLVERQTDLHMIDAHVYVTRAVQPLEDFSKRDYGRPGTDSFSGMLPPKLSRMMINLTGKPIETMTLLDPFCGSGTVLLEGLTLGCNEVYGSDNSQKAVDDSLQNIAWVKAQYESATGEAQAYLRSATEVDEQFDAESIDAIVSEPYMGKPLHGNESKKLLNAQARELAALYIESFEAMYEVLKPGGVAVFIIPQFYSGGEWVTIPCVEEIKEREFRLVPFSKEHPSLLYWRKGQHVGRMIWRFEKK